MPTTDDVIRQIERAFADAPRPANAELLHPQCFDDNDIAALYNIAHWRDLPDGVVEQEYAALSFLSAAGFRYFLPAYLIWVLRWPESGAAVVDSTVFALAPLPDEPLRSFMFSKFALFSREQRAAVRAFLEAMMPVEGLDAARALPYWEETGVGGQPNPP